ncbi:hypothetical protein [Undibacterium sp. TJN19]|uniref:hypothetical protein n=1 Tax=Undibacterium sp. TJN19 TaxID=3413055 RepID=UPI003BF33516
MAEISSVNHIVALLRNQITKKIDHSDKTSESQKNRNGKNKEIKRSQAPSKIEDLISIRVKGLNPDDPKRGKKAFRIFLESVLLSELGENLINDPAFYQMVSDIQSTMEADPQISIVINKAVAELLGKNMGTAI